MRIRSSDLLRLITLDRQEHYLHPLQIKNKSITKTKLDEALDLLKEALEDVNDMPPDECYDKDEFTEAEWAELEDEYSRELVPRIRKFIKSCNND